jgi:hypothetical protein
MWLSFFSVVYEEAVMNLKFVRTVVWLLVAAATVLFLAGGRLEEEGSGMLLIPLIVAGVIAGIVDFGMMVYTVAKEESEPEEPRKSLVEQSSGNGVE